jgi:hypothetical protein
MLCKAILMERNEDFLGQIRLDLAEQLIKQGKKEAALYEIKLHKDHYTAKGWSIKQRVYSLENACGQVVALPENNRDLYYEYISHAEEYAYSEIPYTDLVFVDEWTNQEGKKFQKYVDGRGKEIVINIRRFPRLKKAKLGQVWSFKLYTAGKDKDVPLIVKRSQAADWSVLPTAVVAVSGLNEEKKLFHFVMGQNQPSGVIQYKQIKFKPGVGDFLRIRYYLRDKKIDKPSFAKVKVVEAVLVEMTRDKNDDVVRPFSGRLLLKYHKGETTPGFGFVGDYYVSKNQLVKCGITSDCNVRGKAVLGGDGKWKVFWLEVR